MADDDREVLQRFLDNLFRHTKRVSRLDVILRAQTLDLDEDLLPIFDNLPSGTVYTRQRLADQLNSAIIGHGWSRRYGTVE
jgi:Cdc6-like AAA superfamily ATPase